MSDIFHFFFILFLLVIAWLLFLSFLELLCNYFRILFSLFALHSYFSFRNFKFFTAEMKEILQIFPTLRYTYSLTHPFIYLFLILSHQKQEERTNDSRYHFFYVLFSSAFPSCFHLQRPRNEREEGFEGVSFFISCLALSQEWARRLLILVVLGSSSGINSLNTREARLALSWTCFEFLLMTRSKRFLSPSIIAFVSYFFWTHIFFLSLWWCHTIPNALGWCFCF